MNKHTEFEKIVLSTVRDGINEAIKKRIMDDYNSPVKPLIDDVIKDYSPDIRRVLHEALGETIRTKSFKESVIEAFRHKLSRGLVDSMAGSIDKAINAIKSDPVIKAKMVVAIEKVIEDSQKKESV